MRKFRRRAKGRLLLSLCFACLIVGLLGVGFAKMIRLATNPVHHDLTHVTTSNSQVDAAKYSTVTKTEADMRQGDLICVNEQHHYDFPQNDDRMVSVYFSKNDNYVVKDKNVMLQKHAINALNDMLTDFVKESGKKDVMVVSGYRTEKYQQSVWVRSVNDNGRPHTEEYVAKPGASEHHTGLVLDFSIFRGGDDILDYMGTGKYAWINENAHRYGYVVRYKDDKEKVTGISYEPWHFRYVGKPHAYLMEKENLCLEEYVESLKNYAFGKEHIQVTDEHKQTYEIYYVKSGGKKTDVPVPKDKHYTISGNNIDGFIVTVTL